jgi:hypothetical protein
MGRRHDRRDHLHLAGHGAGAPQTRRVVKRKVHNTILDTCQAVRPDANIHSLEAMAKSAREDVAEHFAGTEWEMSPKHPEIGAAIELHILRNLASAADLALKLE